MSFCSRCGNKIKEGDTFCGNCGAQENTQKTSAQFQGINTQAAVKHSKETLGVILNTLMKPISTIKNLVQILDQKSILIVGIVLALIQGCFSLWKLQQFISMLDKTIIKFAKSLISIISLMEGGRSNSLNPSELAEITKEYDGVRHLIKIPYGNVFLHGIILYVVVVFIMFLGIFVASKLLSKANINALNIGKVVILATIPVLGGELVSIIASYVSSTLGIFVLLIGILASFTAIIISIKEVVDVEDNKLAYALAVVFAIVIACALFAIWKFILSDVSSIKDLVINNITNIFN